MFNLAVYIMAAGASSRFGSPKQLHLIDGEPMVIRTSSKIQHPTISRTTIVIGAHRQALEEALLADFEVLVADDWQLGLSASIKTAARNLPAECTHMMIALADQIAITTDEYKLLIDAAQTHPNQITCAAYNGRRGAPAIFPVSHLTQLEQLKGDSGAGKLLNENDSIIPVIIESAAFDIDSPEDLQA